MKTIYSYHCTLWQFIELWALKLTAVRASVQYKVGYVKPCAVNHAWLWPALTQAHVTHAQAYFSWSFFDNIMVKQERSLQVTGKLHFAMSVEKDLQLAYRISTFWIRLRFLQPVINMMLYSIKSLHWIIQSSLFITIQKCLFMFISLQNSMVINFVVGHYY
jgi:hypothetical protein